MTRKNMARVKKKETKIIKKAQVIFDGKEEKTKAKKSLKGSRYKGLKWPRPWVENKIKTVRKLSKHPAARAAARFGAPAGVALVIFLTLISLISPKNDFEKAKERLAKDPQDFEAHLILAEEFLKNNQFEETERILLLAQQIKFQSDRVSRQKLKHLGEQAGFQSEKVLGKENDAKLDELWERKHYSDPKDIRRLIIAWKKMLEEKPGYRDGHLQLALLYYKIYEDEKVKEHLNQALELDPNYELARKLEGILGY